MVKINWDIVIKIIIPLFALVLGKYLDRFLLKRPKLISYLGHSSVFNVKSNPPIIVHTHAIVIRNAGRATANQVRIGHNILPENIQLYPPVQYSIEREEGRYAEIVIPKLVPREQITISYLYSPPLFWSQIHSYIKSDDESAKVLNVIPTPQMPRWLLAVAWVLIFIGVVSLIYLLIELIRWMV